jgi:glycolate oxidase FAD binding subunit
MDTLSIDYSAPLRVARPRTIAELGKLVIEARRTGHGVYPIGGRTTLDVGLPPTRPGVALDTTALNSVVDYPARDMTITAQAGITLAALQAELAKEGQWLPVDVAAPERATLGGAISLNQSGPHRYGYGTIRDYVIGISFITDEGVEVKAGGRVVKNVAGYDLMKLQIGAVGTLGIITQVTLKVKPRAESSAGLAFSCTADALGGVLDALHASKSRPSAVELLNADAWRAADISPQFAGPWIIAVGFEEKAATVRWQLETLHKELVSAPVHDLAEMSNPTDLWSAITGLQLRPESRYIGKASVQPSQLAAVVAGVRGGPVHAHALSGVLWTHDAQPSLDGAVLRRCPKDQKTTLAVWGRPTGGWDVMRTVKRTLDPDNVFNPGRLFGDM